MMMESCLEKASALGHQLLVCPDIKGVCIGICEHLLRSKEKK
jgi:hypothetical protein